MSDEMNLARLRAVSETMITLDQAFKAFGKDQVGITRKEWEAIKADLLRLAEENEQRQIALKKIELKTRRLITHPPSPGPTLSIMLANALVAVNKIAGAAITPATAGKPKT